MPRERGEHGEFVETVDPEDVLRVFDEVDGPVVTSADVADALDLSRNAARQKLGKLYKQRRVDRRKTAGRVVWWRLDDAEVGTKIDPDDPFFELDGFVSSGDGSLSENIDEHLYSTARAE